MPVFPLSLKLHPDVARHATVEEIREAGRWLSDHEGEIPSHENYGTVQVTSDEYKALIEAAGVNSDASAEMIKNLKTIAKRRERQRTEISGEALDEYIEPYLAVGDGMPLDEATVKFGIAEIEQHFAAVERWLNLLASSMPEFDRADFLTKLGESINKRKQDARIGTERAASRKMVIPATVEETVRKRGAEWATIDHIWLSRPKDQARSRVVRDKPPHSVILPHRDGRESANVPIATNARAELADRSRLQAQDHQQSVWSAGSLEKGTPLTHDDVQQKTLEAGLSVILEREPYSAKRRKLVEIVDLAKAGSNNPEIARELKIPLRTVERYLHKLRREAANAEARELAA